MITGENVRNAGRKGELRDIRLTDGYRILDDSVKFPSGGRIACQGIMGANSQICASKLFPEGTMIYFRHFRAVARAVEEGMCDFGVLPIENNTYGSVKDVYRILGERRVSIVRSMALPIRHVLLAKPGTKMKDIRRVISHEQALGQCSEFLRGLGEKVEEEACLNTAVAARIAANSEDNSTACISAPECAGLYGLDILKKNIADTDTNFTRFIVVAPKPDVYAGANRISIILNVPHKPGALAKVLDIFADEGINMMKLESTPVPGRNFEFSFYIDIEASVRDARVRKILDDLRAKCPGYAFLGNYEEIEPV